MSTIAIRICIWCVVPCCGQAQVSRLRRCYEKPFLPILTLDPEERPDLNTASDYYLPKQTGEDLL